MTKKTYTHLGYYSNLDDILYLYDKLAEDIVDNMLNNNGCFHKTDGCELNENALACYFPTFIKKNGNEYAVIMDIDWDIKELLELDIVSDEDNAKYDKNPSYIDIYVLNEE